MIGKALASLRDAVDQPVSRRYTVFRYVEPDVIQISCRLGCLPHTRHLSAEGPAENGQTLSATPLDILTVKFASIAARDAIAP